MNWFKKLIVLWNKYVQIKPIIIDPNKSTTPDSNPTGCGCDLSKPICDPPVTAEWLRANARQEECGIEAQMAIKSRFCVKHPSDGKIWFLSHIGRTNVKRGKDGYGEYTCFTLNGYRYHICGYQDYDPQGREGVAKELKAFGKYVITECRKES